MTFVALVGEFDASFAPHAATNDAIRHSSAALGMRVDAEWISTERIDDALLSRADSIWVVPGSPYRNLDGALRAIRHAREHNVPCLGTCGGFQHMVIEFARHVLGFKDASHAEYDPYASELFVSRLECSLAGREMTLSFAPGSRVASIYGAESATEHYYCNFGVAREKVPLLQRGNLRITGSDPEGEARVIELPRHAFFIGTLFVPQARSTPERPHPLVSNFLTATQVHRRRATPRVGRR
ncbi:MAG: CTP synthase [Phycisphaerae bacterium]|nr:CTP synthase [Phycisphaerae bacterium]